MKSKSLFPLVLLLFSMLSCNESVEIRASDPFADITFGKSSKTKFLNQLLNDSIIGKTETDSTIFYYNLTDGKAKYPLLIEFNPRQFIGSSINALVINLNGDTLYSEYSADPICLLGEGPRAASEVNQIIEKYKSWYGEPDTVIFKRNFSKSKYSKIMELLSEDEVFEGKEKRLDSIPYMYEWELNTYHLSIKLPRPSRANPQIDSLTYKDAQVRYTVKNYEEELKLKNGSLKAMLAPNKLISIKPGKLRWSKLNKKVYQLIIPIESIGKNQLASVEDRIITGVKFDLIITNIFNEEITRLTDFTYEIRNQLPDPGLSISNPISYTIKYLKNDKYGTLLNDAYEYSQYNTIKAHVQLTAIGFQNGEMLK